MSSTTSPKFHTPTGISAAPNDRLLVTNSELFDTNGPPYYVDSIPRPGAGSGGSSGNTACTITGTPGNDVLRGTPGADTICGLGGNDALYGYAGNDTLIGGSGKDALYGGGGADRLDARDGVRGNDSANGGAGRDACAADRGDAKRSCP